MSKKDMLLPGTGLEIAVIGMAGRFPEVRNIEEFWHNLANGVESITFFSDDELAEDGISPDMLRNPGYVKARGVVDDIDCFDAEFFGYTTREASMMDPQFRFIHECVWEALESAGYVPDSYKGVIGIYAGNTFNPFWVAHILAQQYNTSAFFEAGTFYDKDYLNSRVSYKLNFKGPCLTVQTACSTSLVAVHLACQGLLNGECSMALAGGVTIRGLKKTGYLYQEGMILSPDGHCRPFDAKANGTIGGDGVGVVVLKPFEAALADRDVIHAVIEASAINNDGNRKVSFTAPSTKAQAAVIRAAHLLAEIDIESITYIEAHGTGTSLGDPIEIEALKLAFKTDKKVHCAIGAIKSNIGHLDCAAGVAGFIKTVLSIKHRQIPPSLHFETPNQKLGLEDSPFYVNTRLIEWPNTSYPLRAGVSSFGIGGTNAHVILREAPQNKDISDGRPVKLIVLSAKTGTALDRATENLLDYSRKNPAAELSDVAYTLQVGRKVFSHRKMAVCADLEETIEVLSKNSKKVKTFAAESERRTVVFMFPGQGSQYINMGLGIYQTEPFFRDEVNRCFSILNGVMDCDLKDILYPAGGQANDSGSAAANLIDRTEFTQPIIFTFEYALARLLMKWGIRPGGMIGYSLGEYIAACIAGVFSLEDALKLVALRGKLMGQVPGGAMLSVPLRESELKPLLNEKISLAIVNDPTCIVSGSKEAIEEFEKQMREKKLLCIRLNTFHAAHSALMDDVMAEFSAPLKQIKLNKPQIPYISNLTGDWIKAEDAASPVYWTKQLRGVVRFSDGIQELLKLEHSVFTEIGPGRVLGTFVRQHKDRRADHLIVNLIRHPKERVADDCLLLNKLGQLWLYGVDIDWPEFYLKEKRYRVVLPTYPFERRRFQMGKSAFMKGASQRLPLAKKPDIADWFYAPVWKQREIAKGVSHRDEGPACYLVFNDTHGIGTELIGKLGQEGHDIILVNAGPEFKMSDDRTFTIAPGNEEDCSRLIQEITRMGKIPGKVVHLWNVSEDGYSEAGLDLNRVEEMQALGLHSLLNLAKVLGRYVYNDACQFVVISTHMQKVLDQDKICAEKATLIAPVGVIPIEYPNMSCCAIDVEIPETSGEREQLVESLIQEMGVISPDFTIAYRTNQRWVLDFEPIHLEKPFEKVPQLKAGGIYLITGGLGGIGLVLAEYLARTVQARLILIARSKLPEADKREEWLASHDEEDSLSYKIKKVGELEELGAEVMVVSADVADFPGMQRVARSIKERFADGINGIIHSAGIIDYGGVIHRRSREYTDKVLAAKLTGTLILDHLFKNDNMDFFILCSSLSSILPPFGEVGYAAANAFLDAFAQKESRKSNMLMVSINWDFWKEVGLGVEAVKNSLRFSRVSEFHGILSDEGIEAFQYIISAGLPQVVVSVKDLPALLQVSRNRRRPSSAGVEVRRQKAAEESDKKSKQVEREVTVPADGFEQICMEIFQNYLDLEHVDSDDNFFELGASSLDILNIAYQLKEKVGKEISPVIMFEYPTISSLAEFLMRTETTIDDSPAGREPGVSRLPGTDIAVIGMAGRFPGAHNVEEFWENIKNGVESISFFDDEELIEAGISSPLLKNSNYVKANGILESVNCFDSSFFGYIPGESEIMDPQIRLFHECLWEALEDAGYDPQAGNFPIGLFAGGADNLNWRARTLLSTGDYGDPFSRMLLNNKDFISTRLSYKFNLSGPSSTIYTACSTSLVAIHQACQSLFCGECYIALAGGAAAWMTEKAGYMYQQGMILSPDGHCRPFAAGANGTVFGNGLGIVALKILESATADRDNIHAVVKGSAINNDGNRKVGFTAPSVKAQSEVIRAAYQRAGLEPESITYIEAHATGTPLGDPIEVKALREVFKTDKRGFCALGSVKANIGHLDTAAGIASFIKTVMAVKDKLIPPCLHFEKSNPEIDFENGPFYVNTTLKEWENNGGPLRAGVSSFGFGGTNVHLILEEPPPVQQSANGRPWKLLTVSAQTEQALDKITANLTHYLQKNPGIELADASYTLQTGRRFFNYRRMLVGRDVAEALEAIDSGRIKSFFSKEKKRSVVFMFPGQGSQYVNMGLGLYQTEKLFQEEMDRCFELFLSHMGYDLKEILFSAKENNPGLIDQTGIAQPAIFIFEYALARLLIRWGITPHFMIGHSIGEYVAATLSGVFTLEDALSLVSIRGQLMQSLPRGAMLSIQLSRDQIKPFLTGTLSLAAVNAPSLCVVSGPIEEIDDLENKLNEKGYKSRRLHTSHAFHSPMMEPILQKFREKTRQITPQNPRIPYLSNLTGKFITLADLTGGEYWARHLRQTVLFAEGIEELLKKKNCIFIEVGPGKVLSTFCKRLADKNNNLLTVNLVRHPDENTADDCYLLEKIGQLWLYNVEIDWQAFYGHERRYRISLPPYPFESRRITLKDGALRTVSAMQTGEDILKKKRDIVDWFYSPQWRRSKLPLKQKLDSAAPPYWLLFVDETGIGDQIARKLKEENTLVVVIKKGDEFSTDNDGGYTINPGRIQDYHDLFGKLRQAGRIPDRIVHLWGVAAADDQDILLDQFKKAQVLGFYSLLYLVKALVHHPVNEDFDISVVANDRFDVLGEQNTAPGKNTVSGLIKVVSQEYPNIRCRSIDIELPSHKNEEEKLANQMLVELKSDFSDRVVVLRNGLRWVQFFEPIPLEKTTPGRQLLRKGGVYWLIGGLGEIELSLAEHLSRTVQANLILSHDLSFPHRKDWDHWLSVHPQGDIVSRKIEKLQAMEELGPGVMIFEAVPDNRDQMRAVAAAVRERFSGINGVIYSGSLKNIDIFRSIADEDEPHVEKLFKQKVYGLYVLAEILSEMEMDFCLFMSSLSSILGGLGFAAYSSANSFLDAFARQGSQSSPVTFLSLNWDRWSFEGKQPGIPDPTSLTIEEGIEAFQRILNWGESGQVAISTTDLQARIDYWVALQTKDDMPLDSSDDFDSFQSRPNLLTPYVEPRDEEEKKLSDIWQSFFGIEQIGINDDFFELGGDSIKAMTLITRIHKELDTRLPLTEIFKSSTIKGMAGYIKGAIREKYRAIEPAEKKEFYPLFSAQRRLYIVQQMYPEGTGYNVPYTYVLSGELNLELLAATFKKLIWRHESLRTSFQDRDGEVLQKIHDNVEFSIEHDHGEADEKKVIKHFIRPFDLSRPPLLRVGVIRLAEMKHIFIADMHHIISDGVSQLILTRDFLDLYSGKELPGLRLQYRDFSEWQQREAGTDEGAYRQQEAYWLREFSGNIPLLRLPLDYERPGVKDFDGNFVMFSLGEELSTKLYQLTRDSDTTLYMILLAAYNVLLNKYSGQEDIIVGSPVPGRPHADLLYIIGMFVNMLAIRNRSGGEKSFNYFLLEVKEKVLGALDNQNYQFEELTKKLGLQGDPGRNPLFDAVFEMQSIDIGENRPAETTLKVAPYPLGENIKAPFDLILSTFENSGLINMRLTYSTRLFKESTIELIIRHYREIAAQVTDNPEIRLQDIVLSHQLVKIEPDIEQDSDDDFAFEQVKQ